LILWVCYWKKEATGLLTNLSTIESQDSKWECVLWIHRTCFSWTEYNSPSWTKYNYPLLGSYMDGFVFKSTYRLHSWTDDRLGRLVQSFCNPILVSVVSLNKTQCHKWEQETDHSSLSLSILMGLPFLQIWVRFSQLKHELGDAKGIWTWSGNQGNLIFEENLSIISN
jgi:hypothetical protein